MTRDDLISMIQMTPICNVNRSHHFDYFLVSINLTTLNVVVTDSFGEVVISINIEEPIILAYIESTNSIQTGIHNYLVNCKLIRFHDLVLIRD